MAGGKVCFNVNKEICVNIRSKQLIRPCSVLPAIGLLLACFSHALAATNYVSKTGGNNPPYATWANAATTIQAAVDVASPGDVVIVSNGVYNTGSATPISNIACRVAITNAITVQSVNGPDYTSIVGQGSLGASGMRCAYLASGAQLSGFTLTNGYSHLVGTDSQIGGGGVMCDFGGTVVNCRISYNTGMNGGGAILYYGGTLRNCLINNNIGGALAGGVLMNNGGSVENCTICTNYSGSGGGGVYCISTGTVQNSIIYNNDAYDSTKNWYNSGSNMTYRYTCTTPAIAGASNITADPVFTNASGGDFRLSLGSPCIDSGTNVAWMTGSLDFAGNNRIMYPNGQVDRGCFEYMYYSIVSSVAGSFNGTIVPSGTRYVAQGAGTNYIISAFPHYHVLDVQVDGGSVGASNSYAFAGVAGNHTIAVIFTIDTFNLVVTNEHGTAVPSGTTTFDYGSSTNCSLIDSPVLNGMTQYICRGWTGSGSVPVSGNSTNFNISSITNNSSVTWLWTTNYFLATNVSGYGSINVTNGWYVAGSNASITATPSNGWHFAAWTGDTNGCTISSNQITAPMTQARSITAGFAINMYDITTSVTNGTIAPTGIVQVAYGGTTNFIMTPNPHYHMLDVKIDGVSIGPTNNYTFTNVTSNRSIDAFFTIDTYPLSVTTPYGVPSPIGVTTNAYGTNVLCTANSPFVDGILPYATQYVCVGWTGSGSVPATGTTGAVNVVIATNSTLNWLWKTNYNLHSVAGPNVAFPDGAVDVGPDGWYAVGTNVTITATPLAKAFFNGWSGDTNGCTISSNKITVSMTQPRSIMANFQVTTHYVSQNGSNVPPYASWGNAATNIQNAVNVSIDGERVWVTNGTYKLSSTISVTNGVRLESVNGPDYTTINGNYSVCCYYSGNTNNLVDGFTFTRGSGDKGGGLMLNGGTVRNCIISDNTATNGGGVYLASNAVLQSCRITGNNARFGGGVNIGGTGSVQNCTIAGNSATNSGGGLYSTVSATVFNSIIFSNTAPTGTNYSVSGIMSSTFNCATPLLAGANNIAIDPQLTPSLLLKSTSPCIDAGTSNAPATDLYGIARWDHPGHFVTGASIYDMGANEFVDADGDGMDDNWEIQQFGSTTNNGVADTDGDGLVNLQEYNYSMCPTNKTTYGDSLNDYWKTIFGYTKPHTLGGLTSGDSDQDGLPDSWETNWWGNLAQGATNDFDGDTISNWGEYLIGSNPKIQDTDGDGLTDGDEINVYFTDPRLADTDGDGWRDNVEIALGTDPRNAASFPASISGTTSYSGIQTGLVWIAVTNTAYSTNILIGMLGSYSVSNQHTLVNQWVLAFRDMNGNGMFDAWEASGSYPNNPIYLTNNIAGIDITLADPQYNLIIDGSPTQEGSPLPFGYGTNLLTGSMVITNTVDQHVINNTTQYICTGWTGTGSVPPTGLGTNIVVTITNDSTLTWNWQPELYYTTIVSGPNGSAGRTSGWYSAGTQITNVVVPDPGYHFVGWTGDVPPANTNDTTLVLAMDMSRSIMANFEIDIYTFTPSAGANGSIDPAVPFQLPYGETTNFVFTPDPHYHVKDVQIDGISKGRTNGWTFSNINASHTINADFDIDMFKITASSTGPNGSIVPSGILSFPWNADTNFVMTPAPTYYVQDVLVDGVSVGSVTNYMFNSISSNHSIIVTFDDMYSLAVTASHGTAVPSGTTMNKYGTNVTCRLVDSPVLNGTTQYICTGWTGTGSVPASGTDTNFDITITNHSTLAWTWATNYWLTTNVNGYGSINATSGWYSAGSNLIITATTSNHHHFVNWSGTVTSTNNPLTLPMNIAHSLTANFALDTSVIMATAGANGTITPSGAVQVPWDGSTNFTITASAFHHISNVVVDAVSVGATNSYSFMNVTNSHTINAVFDANQYDLIVNSSYGIPSPAGTNTYMWSTPLVCTVDGSPVTLGMTQYVCSGWTGTGSVQSNGVGTNASFTFTTNSTLTWNWNAYYQLNLAAGSNGSVVATNTVNGSSTTSSAWYPSNVVALLFASPNAHYHFSGWSGDISTTFNPQALLMTRGYSVMANFAIDTLNITANAGQHGSITPGGVVAVPYGGSNVFAITPDSFCYVSNVVVDGVSIGATNQYVFTNVTAAHVISAVFAFNKYTLTVSSDYGLPTPAAGDNQFTWGDLVTCRLGGSPVTAGTTQYICTGWTGTGSVPATGNSTNFSITFTNNSTLLWNWGINYWLDTTAGANGSVDVADGWYRAGTNVTIKALPSSGYWFTGWTGDVPDADKLKNPLTLTMAGPRAITAAFDLSPFFVSTKGGDSWPYTTWQTAATNIQTAVNAATAAGDGRLVLVSNGTYMISTPINIFKGVTVASVNGAGTTIIDGKNLSRCLYINHSNAVVKGFTITHGYRNGDGNGGGVMIDQGGTLASCTINNNKALNYGGGVYCYYGGIISNCSFNGNIATYGGAIQCESGGAVLNCPMISGNSASFGGGVRLRYGGIVTNCAIQNNMAYMSGGGMQIVGTGMVYGCDIIANTSSNYGGGVYCYQGGSVTNCVVRNNTGLYGGGVQCEEGGTVVNCTFNGNYAAYGGGVRLKNGGIAMYCAINNNTATYSGGGVQYSNSGTLRNCIISGNSAATNGGGVYCYLGGTVESCVISGNAAPSAGGLLAEAGGTIVNTIIQLNNAVSGTNYLNSGTGMTYSHCCASPLMSGDGNISGNPRFIDAGAANFHFLAGSPCVDRGINQAWMTGALDLYGNPRIAGFAVDIGAYESIDSDNDGLSDVDEIGIYSTNPYNPDSDGDGMLDGAEVIAGTSPLVASDVFKVVNVVTPPGGGLVITWQSVTGRLYSVLTTKDLILLPWTEIAGFVDVPGNNALMSWTNSVLSDPIDYYKIRVRLGQ